MLFTAGMGIGLVYFGVARSRYKPLYEPACGAGRYALKGPLQQAMNYTFFHWLLHPWAIYIVFALSLAYFSFPPGIAAQARLRLLPL